MDDASELPDLTVQLLFRACRELLRNVLKHARASEVTVTITVEPAEATLTVVDDGVGFDPQHPADDPERLGLRLLTEAVQDAGGHCHASASRMPLTSLVRMGINVELRQHGPRT